MSLVIDLPNEVEAALRAEAAGQKIPAEQYIASLLSAYSRLETETGAYAKAATADALAKIAVGAAQLQNNLLLTPDEADAAFAPLYQAARERVRQDIADTPRRSAHAE